MFKFEMGKPPATEAELEKERQKLNTEFHDVKKRLIFIWPFPLVWFFVFLFQPSVVSNMMTPVSIIILCYVLFEMKKQNDIMAKQEQLDPVANSEEIFRLGEADPKVADYLEAVRKAGRRELVEGEYQAIKHRVSQRQKLIRGT